MKYLNYTVLLSAFLVLILASSCEQKITEPTFTYEVMEYEGKEYLEHYSTPVVMFHYAYADEKNNEYIGWLVDNLGNLRTYTASSALIDYEDPQVSVAEMNNLVEKSTLTGKVVDLDDLVENFKRNRQAVKGTIESLPVDPKATGNTYVYGYDFVIGDRTSTTANSNDCGGSTAVDSSGDYEQVLYKAEGINPRTNSYQLTDIVLEWLEDVANS